MSSILMQKTGFHPVIIDWFTTKFKKPSPPQTKGWPMIARRKNTLILAPTGSGKTLAAFLWSIDELFRLGLQQSPDDFEQNQHGIHTLYISPLKALNNDIDRNLKTPLKEITALSKGNTEYTVPIRTAVRTGDTPAHIRTGMLKKPPHILITTPESLYLLLTSERGRLLFRNLRYIIVDEIHSISSNKRGVHLSLSLERLEYLSENQPVRIGLSATQRPLKRIAAFLGGQQYDASVKRFKAREVTILDCGQRKNLDLKVISPVASFDDLPENSVWPAVYDLLFKLILEHRTTLIFAGMRAQAEKISRALNDRFQAEKNDPKAMLTLAHHGSISRERRFEVEEKLKNGEIPAVIATASLELGIDIGSIDLVVQLESPKSVSSALQRVGRSGHLLKATSKGRLIPLYQSDLDDCVALVRAMKLGFIEETKIPENAFDVLSQQIVSEISMRSWNYDELYNLLRQSYCYRNLSMNAFQGVVEMLSGQYDDSPLRALRAKLNWDKVNNNLHALPGSRHTAVLNAGTIPDRAYYRVVLQDQNTSLGEVEEEFVFESRVGQIFFLGNNEWRINDIKQDRIVVSSVSEKRPRAPFWKGDLLYRSFDTSKIIARFRQELSEHIFKEDAESWLGADGLVDEVVIDNLISYFKRQIQHSGHIATDKKLLVEWFSDPEGEPIMLLHSPFGARINAPWAIVLASEFEKIYKTKTQYSFDDDAILIRLLEVEEIPDTEALFRKNPEEVEATLIDSLLSSQVFAIHFRYNAARALMLARSRPGKRIPLWLQRLRATDLAKQVQNYPDFPIKVETFRECLYDLFDLPALKELNQGLSSGEILIETVHTSSPSPMTSSVLFKFLSENMYELDKSADDILKGTSKSSLLEELLNQQTIPRIVAKKTAIQLEKRWQHLESEYKAKDLETCFNLIELLGPISDDEIAKRCQSEPLDWINKLKKTKRITWLETPKPGWIKTETRSYYKDLSRPENVRFLIELFIRTRGPVSAAGILPDFNLKSEDVLSALESLKKNRIVLEGQLLKDDDAVFWCDKENYKQLYRKSIASRRQSIKPAGQKNFIPFSLLWHNFYRPGMNLIEIIRKYSGCKIPMGFFEKEMLYNRFCISNPYRMADLVSEFNHLIHNGDLILQMYPGTESSRRYIRFIQRGQGSILGIGDEQEDPVVQLNEWELEILDFLKTNGSSMIRDLELGLNLSRKVLLEHLHKLAVSGRITTDNPQALMHIITGQKSVKNNKSSSIPELPSWSRSKRPSRRLSRSVFQKQLNNTSEIESGRWFLTSSFAVCGKILDQEGRALMQARMLLQRYGILVKEWYRMENGLLPWYDIFQVLKLLEWQGEIVRGYFFEGFSGIQFALPEAVELLKKVGQESTIPEAFFVSTIDPALPLGGNTSWNIQNKKGEALPIIRSASNHLLILENIPVIYSENFAKRLYLTNVFDYKSIAAVSDALKSWLNRPAELQQRSRIDIELIEDIPALKHDLGKELLKYGFEKDNSMLVLWLSNAV